MRRLVVVAVTVVAALALAGVAFADSCANVSRAPAACGTTCTAPVIDGNWVWLPSIDPKAPPIWGFSPPGSITSEQFGLPNANGNYLNQQGNASWLHENSALCTGNGNASNVHQTDHGIQSGCGD